MPAPSTPKLCARCRQPLPEGSGYCVTCGCSNDTSYEQLIANENKLIERQFWFRWMNRLARRYPIIHWFR